MLLLELEYRASAGKGLKSDGLEQQRASCRDDSWRLLHRPGKARGSFRHVRPVVQRVTPCCVREAWESNNLESKKPATWQECRPKRKCPPGPQPGLALEICLYFPNNIEAVFPNNDMNSSNDSALPMLNPSHLFLKLLSGD